MFVVSVSHNWKSNFAVPPSGNVTLRNQPTFAHERRNAGRNQFMSLFALRQLTTEPLSQCTSATARMASSILEVVTLTGNRVFAFIADAC